MRALILAAMCLFSATTASADEPSFRQQENVVYAEVHGIGLLMDVFTPVSNKNGIAIIDVISGAWYSDRGKIRDHLRAQTFQVLCARGYTVFAIRPGSVTKFTAPEMVSHLNLGVRWVKEHAQEYGIDPNRLGLMGASAGGHLASLLALTAEKASAGEIANPPFQAVAVFFPPTDFLRYGNQDVDPRSDSRMGELVRRLAFGPGKLPATDEEIRKAVIVISPARLATRGAPPFLLIHGDADPVVPLQQSEALRSALQQADVPVELIVKAGGGHPWPTLAEEVQRMADWFDKQLPAR